jgi:hypothetical protein
VARTSSWGLWFGRKKDGVANLVVYCDSDYEGDFEKRQNTTGAIFFLTDSPITWQSMKQKAMAQSSCKAEYITTANATCQTALAHLCACRNSRQGSECAGSES